MCDKRRYRKHTLALLPEMHSCLIVSMMDIFLSIFVHPAYLYASHRYATSETDNLVSSSCNLLKTSRPRENGCHFADDFFKCIFVNENI